jgi:hypothetical protein
MRESNRHRRLELPVFPCRSSALLICVPLPAQYNTLDYSLELRLDDGTGTRIGNPFDLDEAGTRHRSRGSRSTVSAGAVPIFPVSPTVAYRGVRRDSDAGSPHLRLFNTPLCNITAIVAGIGDSTDKSLA